MPRALNVGDRRLTNCAHPKKLYGGGKPYKKPEVTKKKDKVTPQARQEYHKCVEYQRERFENGELTLTPEGRCSAEFTHRVYPSAYGNIAGASVSRGNRRTFLGDIDPDCKKYLSNKGEPVSDKCAMGTASKKTNQKSKISNRKKPPTVKSNVSPKPHRDMTNAELQALLQSYGLPKSGRKQQLIERIQQHLETTHADRKPKSRSRAKKTKPKGNLVRWIDEKWVNVCEPDSNEPTGYKPCGRSKARLDSKNYPYCRPYYRLSQQTPKTVNEIIKQDGEQALQQRCHEKRKLKQGVNGKPSYYRPDSKKSSPPASDNKPNMSLVNQYNQLKSCVDSGNDIYQPELVTGSKRHKLRVKVRDPITGKTKTVKYGHPDYQDYTTHRDRGRRKNYCKRSGGITCGSRPNGVCDQTTPNFWARTSLWNCPMPVSELRQSISDTECRDKLGKSKN